jgi:tRNA1(Val) A37 N6-methylase TrmN6
MAKLKPDDTTTDAFLGGRLSVGQSTAGHRAGSDAVFLAAAVPAGTEDRVLEAGAGVGVAGLCLLTRVPQAHVTAVEIDPGQCRLAERNADANGFATQFSVVEADVTASAKALSDAGLPRESYDHVLANPPFYTRGEVRVAPNSARAKAHVMEKDGLARWVRFFSTMTNAGGTVTVIHRADCLGLVLAEFENRFGDIAVLPLFPKPGETASRVIVQGRKGSRAGLRLLPGLLLHTKDGTYTAEAEAILREGVGLDLTAAKGNGRPGRSSRVRKVC